jgi:hypothetical protein
MSGGIRPSPSWLLYDDAMGYPLPTDPIGDPELPLLATSEKAGCAGPLL